MILAGFCYFLPRMVISFRGCNLVTGGAEIIESKQVFLIVSVNQVFQMPKIFLTTFSEPPESEDSEYVVKNIFILLQNRFTGQFIQKIKVHLLSIISAPPVTRLQPRKEITIRGRK